MIIGRSDPHRNHRPHIDLGAIDIKNLSLAFMPRFVSTVPDSSSRTKAASTERRSTERGCGQTNLNGYVSRIDATLVN